MNFLEEKILRDGVIKEGNILKVDSFLNHQIDVDTIRQMAYEFKRRFRGVEVNKVLTIEASGIAIEKGQQKGGRELREEGYRLESIAIIESMEWQTQTIRFREQPQHPLASTTLQMA